MFMFVYVYVPRKGMEMPDENMALVVAKAVGSCKSSCMNRKVNLREKNEKHQTCEDSAAMRLGTLPKARVANCPTNGRRRCVSGWSHTAGEAAMISGNDT